jgi:peptidoglycan hydrolase-like protein with peptidoglycan-binding domain
VAAALAVGVVAVGAVMAGTSLLSGDNEGQALPDHRPGPTAVLPTGDGSLRTSAPAPGPSGSPSTGAGTATASPSASPSAPTTASSAVLTRASAAAPLLGVGASGPEVQELQMRLKQEHVYAPKVDSVYDTDVESAVARYQRAHGISGDPSGTYGPNTRRVLESRTTEP